MGQADPYPLLVQKQQKAPGPQHGCKCNGASLAAHCRETPAYVSAEVLTVMKSATFTLSLAETPLRHIDSLLKPV